MKRDAIEIAEAEALLDDLLSRWHSWQQGGKASRGFAPRSIVCGQYRPSRQYDDENGKLDSDLEDFRSRAVDYAAQQMQDPWRAAIYVIARNLCTGREVWVSPRLPADFAGRQIVIAEARMQMSGRLILAGVMES